MGKVDDKQPSWFRCTKSSNPLFTAGVAYEVAHYTEEGAAVICTNRETGSATLPIPDAEFVPHDPWAKYGRQIL